MWLRWATRRISSCSFYIETEDVAASLAKVEAAGGKTVVPPVEIPHGTFAWFTDVEGNTVGLWKPKATA